MALPSAATLKSAVKARWEANDPTGFGSLSAGDRTAVVNGLVDALCTEFLIAVKAGSISTTGTTASACTAGGAAGTCASSGAMV